MNDTFRPTDRDELRARTISSPIGELRLIASSVGLRAVLWPTDTTRRVAAADTLVSSSDEADRSVPPMIGQVLDDAERQLEEYFAGTRTRFDVPLDPVGTEFQQAAWRALCTIEFASTVSYAEQAARMGDANKARAVGAANGRNPVSIIVPCHRVVGADGSLTGFAGGIDTKRWLLDHERRVAGHALL